LPFKPLVHSPEGGLIIEIVPRLKVKSLQRKLTRNEVLG